MSDFAARIRAARAYADLSQQKLADLLGVDVQTVKRREAGKQDPKRSERIALAAITGVPLEFIEDGWEGLSAPPSPEQIRRAAALLRPALLEAAQAIGRDPATDPGRTGEPGHPGTAAGGAGA